MKRRILPILILTLAFSVLTFMLCSCESEQGAGWISGIEAPGDDTVAALGDFYFDEDDGEIYKLTDAGWVKLIKIKGEDGADGKDGIDGNNGINGIDGANGMSGVDGATWYTGTLVSGTDEANAGIVTGAKVGDLYLNTETSNVYECIDTNVWKYISNIKGDNGNDGRDGRSIADVKIKYGYDEYDREIIMFTITYSDTTSETVSAVVTEVSEPTVEGQMLVEYMKGGVRIAIDRLSEEDVESYSLLDGTSPLVESAITNGKSFAGWADIYGNSITSVSYNSNGLILYLQETTITYNLKVQYHAVSDKTVDATYDIDNGFSAIEYENANYRVDYTLQGYYVDGDKATIYSKSGDDYINGNNKLSDKIISNGSKNVTIVAYWTCNYAVDKDGNPITFYFTLEGLCNYKKEGSQFDGNYSIFGTKDGVDNVKMYQENIEVRIEDSDESYCYDLTDNVFDILFDGVTNLHIEEGDAVEFTRDVRARVKTGNQSTQLQDFSSNADELDFEYILYVMYGSEIANGGDGYFVNADKVEVYFEFEIVKAA